MLILVTGGAGSGKSALAEQYAIGLAQAAKCSPVYIATMLRDPDDPETEARIRRHQDMRAGKGFITYEIPCNIRQVLELDGRFELFGRDDGKAWISEEKAINFAACTDGRTQLRRVYLLEDLPNLLANELWSEDGAMAKKMSSILDPAADTVSDIEDSAATTASNMWDPAADTVGTAALFAALETEIIGPLMKLSEEADLVIVTGDVFSEGTVVDAWTDLYMQLLGKAGRVLAGAADRVVEAVSGLPVVLKT